MTAPVRINFDGRDAKVSSRGELIVSPIEFSTSYAASLAASGTTTVVKAVADKRFIMTDILLASDRTNVDTNVTVFEASDFESTTEDKVIIEVDFMRNDRMVATGLNIATDPVKWINLKSNTSAGITITIAGYYIDD